MPAHKPDPYTPDMLDAVIASLREGARRLDAVRTAMQKGGIDELPINNSKNLKLKGLPKVTAFVQAAEKAMQEHQLGG